MKKPIKISIPTPCHENWDAMTPADKGRFCASCQKTVIDFSKASDREIASILKNTNNACGRFRATQLDRDLVIPKEKSTIWMAASAAVISFLTIGNHTISAQTPLSTEQHISETDEIMGKMASPDYIKKITGTVTDSEGIPIPLANIENIMTNTKTKTDYEGCFSINAHSGDVISVNYVSFEESKTIVGVDNEYKITLKEEIIQDGFVMFGAIGPMKQRTFLGRVFHSIGNIFR